MRSKNAHKQLARTSLRETFLPRTVRNISSAALTMKYVMESSGNNSHDRRVKRGNMRFAGERPLAAVF